VFEAAIDRIRRSVAGAGSGGVGQDVGGSLFQRSAQRDQLGERVRHAVADRGDQRDYGCACLAPIWLTVSVDHALVDAPGGFTLDVVVGGEQRLEPLLLSGGEWVSAGVQGASGPIERIAARPR